MVVSLAVSNHILRKNDDKETLSQSTRELMRRRSMANGLRTLRLWVDNDDFFYLECLVVDHRSYENRALQSHPEPLWVN